MRCDLAILGAGPAGANAALAAAGRGLAVALVDEGGQAGGQVWRAPAPGIGPGDDADARAGGALRAALAATPVRHVAGARAWLIGREEDGWRLDLVCRGRNEVLRAKTLLLATGAHERIIPFAGWTLPGVIGLAAATILLKSQKMLPGERVVVAGCGPLLAVVAAAILKGGGRVAAVVDLASRAEWAAALGDLAARPDLLARGLGWRARVLAAGVPWLHRHAVVGAEGEGRLARVRIAPCDATGAPGPATRALGADALAIGHGLVPDTAATRLLRVPHAYDSDRGGWHAPADAQMRAGVPGLWLAGEVLGIGGAAVAELSGRLAGLSVAHALGALDAAAFAAEAAHLAPLLARARRAGGAMARLMRPRPGLVAAIPPDCTVCRCEDVSRAELESAIAEGATEINQLKAFTRAGMGPCQGRMCGEAVAGLLAPHAGGIAACGQATGRAPLRPVPMDALLGDFDYADIPIPAPAPP